MITAVIILIVAISIKAWRHYRRTHWSAKDVLEREG